MPAFSSAAAMSFEHRQHLSRDNRAHYLMPLWQAAGTYPPPIARSGK